MADLRGFLPEDYLERRLQMRTNIICITLFVIVIGAIFAAFYVTDKQTADEAKVQSEVNNRFAEAAKNIDQMEVLRLKKQEMLRKAQTSAALKEIVRRSIILAEITNSMPGSISLSEFKLDSKPARPTSGPGSGNLSALDEARRNSLASIKKTSKEGSLEIPKLDVTIALEGYAPTDTDVSLFSSGLSRCAIFKDVSILSTEQVEYDQQAMRKFKLEIQLNQDLDMSAYEPQATPKEIRPDVMKRSKGAVRFNPDGNVQPLPGGATAGAHPNG